MNKPGVLNPRGRSSYAHAKAPISSHQNIEVFALHAYKVCTRLGSNEWCSFSTQATVPTLLAQVKSQSHGSELGVVLKCKVDRTERGLGFWVKGLGLGSRSSFGASLGFVAVSDFAGPAA